MAWEDGPGLAPLGSTSPAQLNKAMLNCTACNIIELSHRNLGPLTRGLDKAGKQRRYLVLKELSLCDRSRAVSTALS